MNFGKKNEEKDETEEKSKDAKKNVKIDMLKSKGYSERDAVIKGSKKSKESKDSDQVPSPKQVPPSESMTDMAIDVMGMDEYDSPSIELREEQLGSAPEIGSTVALTADAKVTGAHLKEDGSRCFELQLSNISSNNSMNADNDDGRNEVPEAVEEVPVEEEV